MKPLSIAQLCADRGIAPGSTKGAALHLRGIAGGLTAAGHTVTTYTARPTEGPFPTPVRPLSELTGPGAASVDVVYERYSLGHRAGLDLARRIGADFVLEVNAPLVAEAHAHRSHSVEPHHHGVEDLLWREADLVVAVSRPLAHLIESRRDGPTVTISNGFEPRWFGHRRTPSSGSTTPTVAFIGHPKPWHGADRLPGLLHDLGRRGHHPRLMIIGGGPGAAEVLNRAEELGLEDQITVTGTLPPHQASRLLTRTTIGVAPYRRQDPFYFCPLKIIDYLAAGLPIVSTRQGDIDRLVGKAGVVVDPDDDEALTEAVAELLADPERAQRLGANGRRRALASMTWAHAAERTIAAIEKFDRPGVVVS